MSGVRAAADPAHPEGGHAIILLQGVMDLPADPRFRILREGWAKAGPFWGEPQRGQNHPRLFVCGDNKPIDKRVRPKLSCLQARALSGLLESLGRREISPDSKV